MQLIIRQTLDKHGRLTVPAASLGDASDLYAVGLGSFAAVQVMLALEEQFGVEFPDRMLNRKSWLSVGTISACLTELMREKAIA
jgi:acyl carrier protein